MRLVIWVAALTLMVLFSGTVAHAYETLPSQQGVIIILSAVIVLAAAALAGLAAWIIYDAREDRRYREIGDDVEAYLAPLLTGSESQGRAMLRFHWRHGLILWNRTSEAGRKLTAAVDARRPPRFRRPMRRPVWTVPAPAPVEEEALEPLPEPPAAPDPDLHAAPVPDTADTDLEAIEATLGEDSDSPWTADNTIWRNMRDELFAMLPPDSKGTGVAS
jgi:hypothetical protein